MKFNRVILTLAFIILTLFSFQIVGCGSSGGSSSGGGGDVPPEPPEPETPAAISVTAYPDSINPGESANIYAAVFDASGNAMPGIEVIFTLDDPVLAYITSTAATSSLGIATALLTARDSSGEVGVTATVGDVSNEDPKQIVILDESAPSSISLTANPQSILVQGTSALTAEVLDSDGNPVANGTVVMFEVENTIYGSVSATATTNSGFATVTFEAAGQPGTAVINASSGGASASVDVEIVQAPAAAIQFLSAEPQSIALQGTGGIETSTIQFVVKDSNDNPLSDVNVFFEMQGPNGGEYINPSGVPPDEIDVSTNEDGIAQVILHSGDVAGPVIISATIDISGSTMTTKSSVVSIGGGVPSAKRFSVASELLNLPGLAYNNRTTQVTAYFADRFGNYNVLEGTTVSFATEVALAALSSETTIDENGYAIVTVRTQQPAIPGIDAPENVLAEDWETDLQGYVFDTYGYSTDRHPRDGLCSILIYTKGEEHFDDTNANGMYDTGESFLDTFDDPFCDYNDNVTYDGPVSTDPEELYIDAAANGVWDGKNGVWDSNKYIFSNFPILVTGSPIILIDTGSFTVEDGGSQIIKVLVSDINLNQLSPGSEVTISTDVGKLAGRTHNEYLNSNAVGPTMNGQLGLIEYTLVIYDKDPGDDDEPKGGSITIKVDWEGITIETSIYGSVD